MKGIKICHPIICHFSIRIILIEDNRQTADAEGTLCPPPFCLKPGQEFPFGKVFHPALLYQERKTLNHWKCFIGDTVYLSLHKKP